MTKLKNIRFWKSIKTEKYAGLRQEHGSFPDAINIYFDFENGRHHVVRFTNSDSKEKVSEALHRLADEIANDKDLL